MQSISKHIIKQAAQGDMEAFEEIYRISSGFVYSIALRVTNNEADAEEVTQDAFMKIYKNLKDFGFRSAFKTWAYRITVNTAINAKKKELRRRSQQVDYDIAVKTISAPKTARSTFENEDNEKIISSMLAVLNPEQRACLVLREIEGLSYKEIAKVLGININTVCSRLKRARETLFTLAKVEVIKDEL